MSCLRYDQQRLADCSIQGIQTVQLFSTGQTVRVQGRQTVQYRADRLFSTGQTVQYRADRADCSVQGRLFSTGQTDCSVQGRLFSTGQTVQYRAGRHG